MATEASLGYLSVYEIHDGASPGEFVEISEVIEINPGEDSADKVEVTHMQSPNRMREYIAGLLDPGDASFVINWVPGSDTDVMLRELRDSGEVRPHRITFPNGVTLTYDGAITGYGKVVPIDDRMTATITVARSGGETWGSVGSG